MCMHVLAVKDMPHYSGKLAKSALTHLIPLFAAIVNVVAKKSMTATSIVSRYLTLDQSLIQRDLDSTSKCLGHSKLTAVKNLCTAGEAKQR